MTYFLFVEDYLNDSVINKVEGLLKVYHYLNIEKNW